MPYVIRKKGTEEYLQDSAGYGPLESAYPYNESSRAFEEGVAEGEELVQVEYKVVAIIPFPPSKEGVRERS
jgi:hypothetical protein